MTDDEMLVIVLMILALIVGLLKSNPDIERAAVQTRPARRLFPHTHCNCDRG